MFKENRTSHRFSHDYAGLSCFCIQTCLFIISSNNEKKLIVSTQIKIWDNNLVTKHLNWKSSNALFFKARIVLLVDLREIFFRFWVRGVGGTKSFENDQLAKNDQLIGLVIVRVVLELIFYISRTNSETSKVNQQSVLNL